MEGGDQSSNPAGDEFGDRSPAALQRILRKLSAGLDDLLTASGGIVLSEWKE